MPVNRKLWKPPFVEFPSWLCPRCQSATLALDKDSLKFRETGPSAAAHEHDVWEPEWIKERFVGLLVCQNSTCGDVVTISGETVHVEDHDIGLQTEDWQQQFVPRSLFDAPPVFPISEGCPPVVTIELHKAFSLIWSDRDSCANRLRSAVEALLTDRKISRTTLNKKRKRVNINLHDRIVKFEKVNKAAADYLVAIKWLGNTGSHAGVDEIELDDLLHGFEMFERVVDILYDQRDKRLRKVAKKITKRKGRPVKSRQDLF